MSIFVIRILPAVKVDGLVTSPLLVIPTQAGIQNVLK